MSALVCQSSDLVAWNVFLGNLISLVYLIKAQDLIFPLQTCQFVSNWGVDVRSERKFWIFCLLFCFKLVSYDGIYLADAS